jgi:hypothetical protein
VGNSSWNVVSSPDLCVERSVKCDRNTRGRAHLWFNDIFDTFADQSTGKVASISRIQDH